jgi:nucleotide-binding universal stress UspA family protein
MKNILVPVDFSKESIGAIRVALEIASKAGGRVGLLNVIALPVLHDTALMPIDGFRKQLIEELKEIALQKFQHTVQEFNVDNVHVQGEIVVSNHIHTAIIDHLKKGGFDLVVMGTKGVSGLREWMIGSNTEKMVRTSPVPVIAVKSYIATRTIRHIVFPNTLDTENQEELVMKIKALQDFFQATLHIIWINTPALFRAESVVREQLNAFVSRFMLKDFTINVFNYSNEEAGILEYTKLVGGDLIAMGTNGLKGLAHFISGSVAEDVVNHVQYPVWTYCTRSVAALHKQS